MKHPSEYATVPLGAMHVMVVDAGTKVRDERSGEEVEITDEAAATKGSLIYCTEAVYQALRARCKAGGQESDCE